MLMDMNNIQVGSENTQNTNQNSVAPLHNKSRVLRTLLALGVALALVLLAVVLFWKMSSVSEENTAASNNITIDTAQTENTPEFTFLIVPTALETITLPAPTDTTVSDQEAYDRLVNELKPSATPEEVFNDTGYNLPYSGTTYGAYISENGFDELFMIYDELAHVTQNFNNQYNRPPLKDRISGVEEMARIQPAVYGESQVSVYPSWRAVEAFMVGEILSRLDKANAQQHRNNAALMVDRGVAYGLYGQSDAEAAFSIVEQYFRLMENQPSKPSLFSEEVPVETN